MEKWKLTLCGCALVVSTLLNPRPTAKTYDTLSEAPKPPKTAVSASSSFPAILERIAVCESGGKQFNEDGSVVFHHNRNGTTDYGYLQINSIHIGEARKMGMDIMTLEGNKAFGLYLYKENGTRDWSWSQPCWS